jgi:hypothetical protein
MGRLHGQCSRWTTARKRRFDGGLTSDTSRMSPQCRVSSAASVVVAAVAY